MTDMKRLGATLGTLGTLLEMDGERAKSTLRGWAYGPANGGDGGERGGGLGTAGEDERKEEAKRRHRAAQLHDELTAELRTLEKASEAVLRILAVALPVHPAQLRNKRTGDLDPMTAADAAAAGFCASCWRNDQQMVVREKAKRSGLYYSSTLCRWCLGVKATYGIEPPLDVLKLHHAGRRISEKVMQEAVAAVLAAQPKSKKQQRKAKRKSAAA